MKRIFLYIITLLALSGLFSCAERNAQEEFAALCVAEYEDPQKGIDVCQEYIDHFYKTEDAPIAEVSAIRQEYRRMEEFFSTKYTSLQDFNQSAQGLDAQFSKSKYEGVKNTWASLYKKERESILSPLLEKIDEDAFDSFYTAEIKEICARELKGWDVESINKVGITTITSAKEGSAKQCRGVYRVDLKGGGFLGGKSGEARVSVSGEIGPNPADGSLDYTLIAYNFIDKPE